MSWNDVAGETGFIVERSSDGGATFTQIGTTGQGVTTYDDTGLNAGTPYKYEIVAINSGGSSPTSAPATGTTLPAVPTPVVASATVTGTTATVTWTAATTATSYLIERSPNGTTGWTSLASTSGLTYPDTGLANGTTYYYRVTAANGAGVSAPSNVVNITTAPAAPINLTATTAAPMQINLHWTDVPSETGFVVQQSANGTTGWMQVASVPMGTTSVPIGGLAPSTLYYFRILATNSGGLSAPSNVAHATTTAPNPTYANLTTLYGLTGNGKVYSINTTSGAPTQIGTLSFGTNAAGRDPLSGNFYYISTGNSTVAISEWNPNSGVNSAINGAVPLGNPVAQAAFRDDGQFFLTTDVGDLYAVNSDTGIATLKGSIHANGSLLTTGNGDMAFAPDGTLYIETSAELYTITSAAVNAAAGTGSIIAATDLGPTNTANLQIAFGQSGVLFGTDSGGQLYTLNTSYGNATAVGTPGGTNMGDLASVPLYGDLTIAQSASSFVRNTVGNYTIAVTNAGPDTTVGPTTLVDVLDTGVTFASGSGNGWNFSVSGSTVTMTYSPNLAAAASTPSVILNVNIGSAAANTISNGVLVSSTEFETNVTNNGSLIVSPVTG